MSGSGQDLGVFAGWVIGQIRKKGTNVMDRQLVCYCFNYSADDIRDDYERNGFSTILERIAAEKKSGGCNCATNNPKGR